MANQSKEHAAAGEYWSKKSLQKGQAGAPVRRRWWQSPFVVSFINERVSGDRIDGQSSGLIELLKAETPNGPLNHGVSVGGGTGGKEIRLVREGLVERFTIYELSEARIEQGRERAFASGLEDQIHFVLGDAFESVATPTFDLVHWNNALHHMFDVRQAVAWSKDVLVPGGLFCMDDFVGATRFQWSEDELQAANRIRGIFKGSDYLRNPKNTSLALAEKVVRPDRQGLIDADPSEAADSDAILPAITEVFPSVRVVPTGGLIYNLALKDMFENFDEGGSDTDRLLLQLLLEIDLLHSELGRNHYAVALARKPAP